MPLHCPHWGRVPVCRFPPCVAPPHSCPVLDVVDTEYVKPADSGKRSSLFPTRQMLLSLFSTHRQIITKKRYVKSGACSALLMWARQWRPGGSEFQALPTHGVQGILLRVGAASQHIHVHAGGLHHSSYSFRRLTWSKFGMLEKVLKKGYDTLFLDTDIVWFQDPRPFLGSRKVALSCALLARRFWGPFFFFFFFQNSALQHRCSASTSAKSVHEP